MALLGILVSALAIGCAFSARIACFSSFGGSQYLVMRLIAEELGSRGHEVVLFVDSSRKIKSIEKVIHRAYKVPYEPGFTEGLVKHELEGNKMEMFRNMFEMLNVMAERLLNDTEIIDEVKNFDLIVNDFGVAAATIIADFLDIPRVEIIPGPPVFPGAMYHMVPMPVSFVPTFFSGFTDRMAFFQRVMNLGFYVSQRVTFDIAFGRSMNSLKAKHNMKPEKTFQEAVGDAELLIITADFALEFPQPLLPGHIMVGALNVGPPKPLPPDLEEFVNNFGEHGLVIVSFGSNFASGLKKKEVDILAEAFGKLKQGIIWRLKGYIPSNLRRNIKAVDWMPQQDLLGHKEIKAFVSHVGHNSYYESAYHGVPLMGFPLFGDQHSNAKKMEHFGLGLAVDHNTVDSQQLYETITRVISEPSFKAEASRISRLLQDSPRTPLEKTADWIEYVIRHGGAKHLRAQVFNIPWYQYYLLDVMAFLVAIVTLVVIAIRLMCRCLCHLCCRRNANKTKAD